MGVFTVKPQNQPTLVRKKLRRFQAHGQFWPDDNLIEIDERLKGKREMIIIIHEYLHYLFPDLAEETIIVKSEYLADFLWKQHFRKADLSLE